MKRKKVLLILAEVLLGLIFLFALVKLTGFDKWAALKLSMGQISDYQPDLSALESPGGLDADGKEISSENGITFDWSGIDHLSAENSDFFAWLTLPGTEIDYPVMHGADNDYYLHRDYYGKYLAAGTLFADYRCADDLTDSVTMIYGHNMHNGTMFHSILDYNDQTFLEENRSGWLVTGDTIYQLEFFACCRVSSESELYTVGTMDENTWNHYLTQIEQHALSELDIGLSYGDHLVALSTCSYEFENARTILFARLNDLAGRADTES